MKKKLLMLLGVVVLSSMVYTEAKSATSSDLTNAIKMYKAGNYSQCYVTLERVIAADPSNALAYYYMAMTSAQIGRKDEAIDNYEKTLQLAPEKNNLSKFAAKGKRCLETPDKCQDSLYESLEDEFIQSKVAPRFSTKVRGDLEKLRIEQMMRDINRNSEIAPQKFKEYKDFSSMNNSDVPTNDEIVAAMRVLQNAGFGSLYNNSADLALFPNSIDRTSVGMMGSSMNPQLIQALITNNLTQGF